MGSELELEIIGVRRGQYQVRVVHAAAGGEPAVTLKLDVDEVLGRRQELETTVLASAVAARQVVPANEEPVRQVGQQLFEALFDPERGTYLCRHEPLVRHVPAPYTPASL